MTGWALVKAEFLSCLRAQIWVSIKICHAPSIVTAEVKFTRSLSTIEQRQLYLQRRLCIVSHHKSHHSLLFKIAPIVGDNSDVSTPGPQTDDGSPGEEFYVIGTEFISRVTSPGPPVSPSLVARSQCPGVTGSSGD